MSGSKAQAARSVVPVILSGGSGTRLWPLSRALYPKQFLRFFNSGGPSLLGATLHRLSGIEFAPPILVCNNEHRFLVREEVERAGLAPRAIVLEPVQRNTAPAIAVAALAACEDDGEAILAVMPSDHAVGDNTGFIEAVRGAAQVAARGKLVLFGVKPREPHTGYGYIRQGEALPDTPAFRVAAFVEKPDRSTAQRYLASGDYFWNSGIFVFQARALLDELARFEPAILEAAREALDGARQDLGFLRLEAAAFARSPSLSLDYAVMERTQNAAMMPLDVGWNDIGSWTSLWEIAPRDAAGNYVHGEAILQDTSGCYVHSEKSFVSTIGLKDVIIVDTPDALLVAEKSRAQDVSGVVAELRRSNRKEHAQHLRNYRPWGFFETLNLGPRFQVKLLHVKPGGKLSLQMHHHRSEHWVVVQGTAKVVIAGNERLVQENESVYISATQWHRLENPGKVPLEIIEVQTGTYLGEDDIIRSDDIYNRGAEETR